ncbi:MAG TPA: hypothetical protein VNS08_17720 [Ureibacillus sp.]|nr:hypothetical protein [Ureibacillus sp.]
MGDQIYADDVADPLFLPINQLGKELMGIEVNLASIEQRIKLKPYNASINKINGRKELIKELAKFSTRNGANHLIQFGEYAAMYLFAWSPVLWELCQEEGLLQPFDKAYEENGFHLKLARGTDKLKKLEKSQLEKRYSNQEKHIANCHSATYKIRRVFANIPTYMIFDDHDITDDWNINADWKETVQSSPIGKHIVANGLSAYFAFQGWGNTPQVFGDTFIQILNQHFKNLREGKIMAHYEEWVEMLWTHHPWHFVTPTFPRVLFLDTRTMREYEDKPNTQIVEELVEEQAYPPQLVNEAEYKEVTKQLKDSGWKKRDPLIIVSPTPVIGFDFIEKAMLQILPILSKMGVHVQTIFDVEAWRYNGKGLTNLLNQLAKWEPSNTIILSGDVHYSFSVTSSFSFPNNKELQVKQITSSPIKNMSFKNFGLLMKVMATINQMLQKTDTLYRYCDPTYKIHDTDKRAQPDEKFLWKEQLLYDQIAGKSIIETENTLGILFFSRDHVENKFIRES